MASGKALSLPVLRVINDSTNSLAVVQRLEFHCCILPLVNKLLVKVEATICNELSLDYEAHTMHLPLHPDCVLCALSVQSGDTWLEACSVPKEVPPLPKSTKTGPSTSPFPVWSTPLTLAFQQPQGVRFNFVSNLEPRALNAWAFHLPFSFSASTEVHSTRVDCHPEGSFSSQPQVVSLGDSIKSFMVTVDAVTRVPQSGPRTVVAYKHFVSFIPQAALEALLPLPTGDMGPQHVLLAFDVSLSCFQRWKPSECDDFLAELESQYRKQGCSAVTFTMAKFSQQGFPVVQKGTRVDVVKALGAMAHEGGTDMRTVDSILSAVQAVDAVVVFSDGLDSLGDGTLSLPRIMTTSAPLYTVLPTDSPDTAYAPNKHFLHWLAAKRGGLCLPMGPELAFAIAHSRSRTYAISLKIAQNPNPKGESKLHFETVPDWRDPQFWWPSNEAGLELSGTVPADSTQISITLRRGSHVAELPLVLPPEDNSSPEVMRLVCVAHAILQCRYFTRTVASLGACAGQVVKCSQRYRIAGEFTTLKILETMQERLEYDQPYRDTDPMYNDWVQAKEQWDKAAKEATAKVVTRRLREAHAQNSRNCKVLQSVDRSRHQMVLNPTEPEKSPVSAHIPKKKQSFLGFILDGPTDRIERTSSLPTSSNASFDTSKVKIPQSGSSRSLGKSQWPESRPATATGAVIPLVTPADQMRKLEATLNRKLSDLAASQAANKAPKEYNAPFGDDDPTSPFMDIAKGGSMEDFGKPAEESGSGSGQGSSTPTSPSTDQSEDADDKAAKPSAASKGKAKASTAEEEVVTGTIAPAASMEAVPSYTMPERTFSIIQTSEVNALETSLSGSLRRISSDAPVSSDRSASPGTETDTERRQKLLDRIKLRRQEVGPNPKAASAKAAAKAESDEDTESDTDDDDDDDEDDEDEEESKEKPLKGDTGKIYIGPLVAQWHCHLKRLNARSTFQTFGLRHMHAATKLVLDRLGMAVPHSPESFNWAAEYFFSTYDQYQDNPGYYLYVAEMFRDAGAPAVLTERIVMCILEVCEPCITAATLENRNPGRRPTQPGEAMPCSDMARTASQVIRSVGYFLLGTNQTESAVQVLNTLLQVAPGEPITHLDIALACFLLLRKQSRKQALEPKVLQSRLLYIFKHLGTVLTGVWHAFWEGIEWPAMLLLTWVTHWAEAHGVNNCWALTGLHPSVRVPFLPIDLLVWCCWDTARAIVDLNVTEPNNQQVSPEMPYSSMNPAVLTNESRTGFGPTCYLNVKAKPGMYKVACQHHTRDKDSIITGPTRVLVMAARYMGDPARDKLTLRSMRLPSDQEFTGALLVPM